MCTATAFPGASAFFSGDALVGDGSFLPAGSLAFIGDIPPFAAGPGLSRMRAVAAAALQLHPLARPSCAEIAAMLGGSRPEFAKSESE